MLLVLGLSRAVDLTKLQSLGLKGSKVTKKGVMKLQQTLPDCNISP